MADGAFFLNDDPASPNSGKQVANDASTEQPNTNFEMNASLNAEKPQSPAYDTANIDYTLQNIDYPQPQQLQEQQQQEVPTQEQQQQEVPTQSDVEACFGVFEHLNSLNEFTINASPFFHGEADPLIDNQAITHQSNSSTNCVDNSSTNCVDNSSTNCVDNSSTNCVDNSSTNCVDNSSTNCVDNSSTNCVDNSSTNYVDNSSTNYVDNSSDFIDSTNQCENKKIRQRKPNLNKRYTVQRRRNKIYYPCPKCPQVCTRKSNLERHDFNVHQEQRPHHCVVCDKNFAQRKDLTRHYDSKRHQNKASGAKTSKRSKTIKKMS